MAIDRTSASCPTSALPYVFVWWLNFGWFKHTFSCFGSAIILTFLRHITTCCRALHPFGQHRFFKQTIFQSFLEIFISFVLVVPSQVVRPRLPLREICARRNAWLGITVDPSWSLCLLLWTTLYTTANTSPAARAHLILDRFFNRLLVFLRDNHLYVIGFARLVMCCINELTVIISIYQVLHYNWLA